MSEIREEAYRMLDRVLRAADEVVHAHSHLAEVQALRGALTAYWQAVQALSRSVDAKYGVIR